MNMAGLGTEFLHEHPQWRICHPNHEILHREANTAASWSYVHGTAQVHLYVELSTADLLAEPAHLEGRPAMV